MDFWLLVGLWLISGNVAFGQHRPSYVVTRFYGFYPRGLDWISADCVHSFDSLSFGRQVVYAMCQLELPSRFLHGSAWLPFTVVLVKWSPVSTSLISFAYENGLFMTGDEYIFLFMYFDAIFSENGHVAIVSCLSHTH